MYLPHTSKQLYMYVTLLFISLSANHNTDVIWQEKIKHQTGSGFSFLSKKFKHTLEK